VGKARSRGDVYAMRDGDARRWLIARSEKVG
jgi:hypothetical protein